jgi:hypothetical protein
MARGAHARPLLLRAPYTRGLAAAGRQTTPEASSYSGAHTSLDHVYVACVMCVCVRVYVRMFEFLC